MGKQFSRSGFKSISEVISKENEFSNLRETIKNYDIAAEFEKIFPELKLIAQAVKVEKKILFLRVENSVWKSELNLMKNLIAEKINKFYNNELIKTIKFI